MKSVYRFIQDFFALFFPELCAACGKNLFNNESVICTDCIYHLPYTNFHTDDTNRAARQLYGRVPFVSITSFLYFSKGSKVQNLIHQLKYNKKPEVGTRMGELYGVKLKDVEKFKDVDLIIPVPLHPSRLRKRGYNQSEFFAQGLAEKLNVRCENAILLRSRATATQTRKSRFSRFENMQEVFAIAVDKEIEGKHILLVDDVLTTGATLEACALELLKVPNVRISIATIAFAD